MQFKSENRILFPSLKQTACLKLILRCHLLSQVFLTLKVAVGNCYRARELERIDVGVDDDLTELYELCWRHGGLIVSELVSGSSGPGSTPGQGHCVVLLGKALNSHSAFLHPGV